QLAVSARFFARLNAGSNIAARIAIIAITTNNSMSVNPRDRLREKMFSAASPIREREIVDACFMVGRIRGLMQDTPRQFFAPVEFESLRRCIFAQVRISRSTASAGSARDSSVANSARAWSPIHDRDCAVVRRH